MKKKTIKLKRGVHSRDFTMLHPNLFLLISFYISYGAQHDLDTTLTSLISDRSSVKGATGIHGDGRAADGGIRGWPEFHIYRFVHQANIKFKDIAAIGAKSKKPIAMVYGDAKHLDHIHMQVRR